VPRGPAHADRLGRRRTGFGSGADAQGSARGPTHRVRLGGQRMRIDSCATHTVRLGRRHQRLTPAYETRQPPRGPGQFGQRPARARRHDTPPRERPARPAGPPSPTAHSGTRAARTTHPPAHSRRTTTPGAPGTRHPAPGTRHPACPTGSRTTRTARDRRTPRGSPDDQRLRATPDRRGPGPLGPARLPGLTRTTRLRTPRPPAATRHARLEQPPQTWTPLDRKKATGSMAEP
jgi:hypothetical protein